MCGPGKIARYLSPDSGSRFARDVLREHAEGQVAVRRRESRARERRKDYFGRYAGVDGVPVKPHQSGAVPAGGARNGGYHARHENAQRRCDESIRGARDLEDASRSSRLQHAPHLGKERVDVGDMAKRESHAHEIEARIAERQPLAQSPNERITKTPCLAKHSCAGIEADHGAAEGKTFARDEPGSGGDVVPDAAG